MNVIEYGGRVIPVKQVTETFRDQNPPAIRQGPPNRSDRQGVRQYKLQSLHKGLGILRGSEINDNLRYSDSEGLIAHQPFSLFLPYVRTTQSALTATDISGFRAANKRVHSLNSTLGQSKLRFYAGVGTKLYRNDSDTVAALEDSGLVMTDNITGMFEGKANNTRYLIITSDDDTDDISGVADPGGVSPVLAKIVAHLHADDWFGGGASLNTIGSGYNIFYGKNDQEVGLWYTKHSDALLTALSPVVLNETRSVVGTLDTAVTSATFPSSGSQDFDTGTNAWTNPEYITADGNPGAAASGTLAASTDTNYLIASGFDFTAIPSSAVIVGIVVTTNSYESDTDDNISVGVVELLLNGSKIGVNLGNDNEISTSSSSTQTFGSSSTTWGASLTGADVQTGIAVRAQWRASASAVSASASVDYISMTITYRLPGAIASIPLGGYVLGKDPSDPTTVYIVAPERQDETTSVNVPRILWKCDFSYDAAGNRPTVAVNQVNTGLAHIEAACFALGGVCVTGDTKSGVGKTVKLVRSDGSISDLGFGTGGHGYAAEWGIINMWGQGRNLICEAATEAGTSVQTWLQFDGTWNPMDKKQTVTSLPLAWAEDPQICVELLSRYRIYPDSTNTNVSRIFHPRNTFLDPINNNTSEIKEDGYLSITLPELDLFGPEEAEKQLLTIWCLTREVSSTNAIKVEYSTDASSYTTATTFTSYASKYTFTTPVSFRTLKIRISLTHTASSTGTPNGLPILFEGLVRWVPQRKFTIDIEPDNPDFLARFPGGIGDLWDTLSAMGAAQDLKVGYETVKCVWNGYESKYIPSSSINAAPERYTVAQLVFDEVVQ